MFLSVSLVLMPFSIINELFFLGVVGFYNSFYFSVSFSDLCLDGFRFNVLFFLINKHGWYQSTVHAIEFGQMVEL